MANGNINGTPFKVAGEIKQMAVSQRQMAAAIGLSTTRVNALLDEKIMVRDESRVDGRLMLFDSLQNYFLLKKTTSDGEEDDERRATKLLIKI